MAELEEAAGCPACGELAEPEQDDDLVYFACGCGHEFGYRRVAQGGGDCQLGVPEPVRRFAMGGIVGSSKGKGDDSVPVFLTRDCHIPLRPGV